MTDLADEFPSLAPAPLVEKAGVAARVGAGVAALVTFVVGALISFGAVLAAPLGMWMFGAVQRRRGRNVGRGASWMAASVAVAIALVLEAGALVMRLPDGSVAKIITTSDSASAVAEKQPPPAWLERVAPGAAEQNRAMTPRRGSALATALKWWGTAAGLLLIGALYGSIGWAGAMLWGLGVRGVWDRPLQVRPT